MSNIRNAIIDPGIIPVQFLRQSVEDSLYNIHIIQYDWRIKQMSAEWDGIAKISCHIYSRFKQGEVINHYDQVGAHYNRVYNAVVSDYRTMQISERVKFRVKPWHNDFNDLATIDNLVTNYLDWLIELAPAFVFFHSTPHDITSWVLGKVAEAMDIPVYLSKTTPLPWKSFLVIGLDEHRPVNIDYHGINNVNEKLVSRYFQLNSQKYDDAIPSYEKKRLDARKGHFWSWHKELKEPLSRPHRLVAMFRKHTLYKHYQNLATSDITDEDYIIVFLHYQPERTSLPEGQFFVQQLHLVRTLHLACPHLKIYVKEHPSIFVGHFDIRYRNKAFYNELVQMDNVELVDIRIDSFSLLDNALCIATITGTVGVQALIRGKAVLCFGTSSYVGFEGCYAIRNCQDVENAIVSIQGKKFNERYDLPQLTHERLNDIDKHSSNGVNGAEVEDFYDQNFRLKADGQVLRTLLGKRII